MLLQGVFVFVDKNWQSFDYNNSNDCWLTVLILTGMWNQIFLGSYMSLFVAIPFAYFFTESEGFAGSRKV